MPQASAAKLDLYLPWLDLYCKRFGIQDREHMARFLATVAVESGQLSAVVENLKYTSNTRIAAVWPKRFTLTSAKNYVNNAEKLGNFVYANRGGNGPEDSGDGFRYRGRGLIMCTFRSGYQRMAQRLLLPLLEHPELLEQPEHAAASAVVFYVDNCMHLETFKDCCVRVNGGTTGLAERVAFYQACKGALQCS